MRKVGLWLAIAALLVNGPRFVLIFLRVDGINIPLQAEAMMLGATGVATGLVLTGGGAYIAHQLAEAQARGMIRFVMILCWFLLLGFSVILLAPLLVSAIRLSPLNTVLTSSFFQWIWSITAVGAVEVISAGAMAAYALEGKKREERETETQHSAMSILTGALVRRLENSIAPQPVLSEPHTIAHSIDFVSSMPSEHSIQKAETENNEPTDKAENEAHAPEQPSVIDKDGKISKLERQRLLIDLLQHIKQEEDIQVDELAEKLHISRQTIYRDLAELKSKRLLPFQQ